MDETKANSPRQITETQDEAHVHLALGDVFNRLVFTFAQRVEAFNKPQLRIPDLIGNDPEQHTYEPLVISSGSGPALRTVSIETLPKFQTYLQSWPPDNSPIKGLDLLLPVGEYGEQWSMALLQGARVLYTLLTVQPETRTLSECKQVNERYGDLLTQHTFQKDSLRTLAEGFQTLVATASVLTAQRVRGYEQNPVALFRKLVEGNLIDQVALRLPISAVFPMVDSGVHFNHPLQPTREGITFTDGFRQLLANEKAASLTAHSQFPTTHKGCPVAIRNTPLQTDGVEVVKKSGITQISQTILPYVEHFYSQPRIISKTA